MQSHVDHESNLHLEAAATEPTEEIVRPLVLLAHEDPRTRTRLARALTHGGLCVRAVGHPRRLLARIANHLLRDDGTIPLVVVASPAMLRAGSCDVLTSFQRTGNRLPFVIVERPGEACDSRALEGVVVRRTEPVSPRELCRAVAIAARLSSSASNASSVPEASQFPANPLPNGNGMQASGHLLAIGWVLSWREPST